jgi:NAD(P)-dependent dehydrogenase (short-subunit alcohol dehydrogenase family)
MQRSSPVCRAGLGEAIAVAMLERGFTVLGVGRTASPRLAGKRFHLAACDLRSRRCWPRITRRCASSPRASRPR